MAGRQLPSFSGSLLTSNDVARLLSVKRSTVYTWAAQGRIPYLRLGKQLRFEEAALHDLIRASRRQTETP